MNDKFETYYLMLSKDTEPALVLEQLYNDTGEKYVLTEDTNKFILQEDAHLDAFTDQYYEFDEDFRTVVLSQSGLTGRAHLSSLEYDAFLCDRTYKWYSSTDFRRVEVNGDNVCYEACQDDLYYWDSDDEYHWECEPDEGDCEDEDSSTRIPEYHTQKRPDSWAKVHGIGVELEIFTENRFDLYQKIPSGILGETDGSLHDSYGIELIGAPFPYSDYKENKTPWEEMINHAIENGAKSGESGYRDGYGMHVSLSRGLFDDFNAAKFIVFFNMQDELCKMLAQRESIWEGDYQKRKVIRDCIYYTDRDGRTSTQKTGIHKNRKVLTGKYEAVSASDSRLEVRIFRSTVRYNSFMKNVEFAEAVRKFVHEKSISTSVVSRNSTSSKLASGTDVFCKWLNDQDDFIHLKRFIGANKDDYSHIKSLDKVIVPKVA